MRGTGAGRRHGGRGRPQRRARRRPAWTRSKQLGGQAVVPAGRRRPAASRSKRCWPPRSPQLGRVDMLVNCAGVNSASTYFDVTRRRLANACSTINLTAVPLGLPDLRPAHGRQPDGGSILNIGSVTAHLPLSRVFAYSASKAAVVNLTQNVARELAPHGVRVNALCPGFFPAEQNRKILDADAHGEHHAPDAHGPLRRAATSWSARRCCCCRARPAASSPARPITSTAASRPCDSRPRPQRVRNRHGHAVDMLMRQFRCHAIPPSSSSAPRAT